MYSLKLSYKSDVLNEEIQKTSKNFPNSATDKFIIFKYFCKIVKEYPPKNISFTFSTHL